MKRERHGVERHVHDLRIGAWQMVFGFALAALILGIFIGKFVLS